MSRGQPPTPCFACGGPSLAELGLCHEHYEAARRVGPIPQGRPRRTDDEQRDAWVLVRSLRTLDEWRLARWCELTLRRHLGSAVEVRPEWRAA